MSLSTVTTRASFKLASPVKKYLGTQIANGPRTVTLLVIILKYFISENHTPDDMPPKCWLRAVFLVLALAQAESSNSSAQNQTDPYQSDSMEPIAGYCPGLGA